jgi:2-C-methyl-D-erythritol 4-phosphate cytidylyltransferase
MAELGGREMHIVPASEKNIKVTTIEDIDLIKALMMLDRKEIW